MHNMNEKIIVLDMNKSSLNVVVNAKQGDEKTRFIIIKLVENDKQYIPSIDDKVIFRFIKPDGKSGIYSAGVNKDGTITVELTEQVLAVPGIIYADIAILNNEKIISSGVFAINSTKIPVNGEELKSSNEFIFLNEISQRAQEAEKKILEIMPTVNSSTEKANAAADKANKAANNAALQESKLKNYNIKTNLIYDELFDKSSSKKYVRLRDGYALNGTGGMTKKSESEIAVYSVLEGEVLHVKLRKDDYGVFQWSTTDSAVDTKIVGEPINSETDDILIVPKNAKFLLVSQLKSNTYNTVSYVSSNIDYIKSDISQLQQCEKVLNPSDFKNGSKNNYIYTVLESEKDSIIYINPLTQKVVISELNKENESVNYCSGYVFNEMYYKVLSNCKLKIEVMQGFDSTDKSISPSGLEAIINIKPYKIKSLSNNDKLIMESSIESVKDGYVIIKNENYRGLQYSTTYAEPPKKSDKYMSVKLLANVGDSYSIVPNGCIVNVFEFYGKEDYGKAYLRKMLNVKDNLIYTVKNNGELVFSISNLDESEINSLSISAKIAKILNSNIVYKNMLDKFKTNNINECVNIRVATYNIGHFAEGELHPIGSEENKLKYRDTLSSLNCDILALQEDDEVYNEQTGESPRDAVYGMFKYYEKGASHIYTKNSFASVYKITNFKSNFFEPSLQGSQWRGYSEGDIRVGDKNIHIISTQLDWSKKDKRYLQINKLIEVANKYERCIICGDFNPNSDNGEFINSSYQEDYKLWTDAGYQISNAGYLGTLNTFAEHEGAIEGKYPWDNIIVTPNIKIRSIGRVVKDYMKDHYPIWAELIIY